MKLHTPTKLAVAGALSLAAVLGSALSSTAAPTAPSGDGPAAAAPPSAGPSASTDAIKPVEVKRFDPVAGATQSIHTFACPPSHPWLAASTSGWGLRGIDVEGDGYIAGDVAVDVRPMRDLNKLAIGWDGSDIAVKIIQPHDDDFAVVADCTNDRTQAYLG